MIIKFKNYDGIYRVAVLSCSEAVTKRFLNNNMNVMHIKECSVIIYPDNVSFDVEEQDIDRLKKTSEYDVFEIYCNGAAYQYYNNSLLDNTILVTNRCNSNCIMCPTPEIIRKTQQQYSAEQLINIVKYFPSDACHITITGGEPFLVKKDMFRLLSFLKSHMNNTNYLLLTNGRAFCSKEYTDLFAISKPSRIKLGIPIHGYNEQTHDHITQAKGSFVQTIAGLKNLIHINAVIEIRIVVSKLNHSFIDKIAELIVNELKGISCVKIMAMEMTGNAAKNRDLVWIDYPDAFSACKEAIEILVSNGIDVGLYNFPLCSVDRRFWDICEKSISEHKIRYAPQCSECKVKDACGGVFSGTIRLAKEKMKPIGDTL